MQRNAARDSTLTGALNDGAVGKWVGEGYAEFKDVGTVIESGNCDIVGDFKGRVAGGEIHDESGFGGEVKGHLSIVLPTL